MERFEYVETGSLLLLQAYLERVINGGGRIYRKYDLICKIDHGGARTSFDGDHGNTTATAALIISIIAGFMPASPSRRFSMLYPNI